MAGFSYATSMSATRDTLQALQLAPSQTIQKGDALKYSAGKVTPASAQTDKIDFIADEPAVSTATSLTLVNCVHVSAGSVFKIPVPLLASAVAANSNSTNTQAIFALTGSVANDLAGMVVYFPTTKEQRVVVSNTYNSNIVTVVFAEPTARAITTGDTCSLTPLIVGNKVQKLDSSTPSRALSAAKADITGGNVIIRKIDMKNKFAYVSFAA